VFSFDIFPFRALASRTPSSQVDSCPPAPVTCKESRSPRDGAPGLKISANGPDWVIPAVAIPVACRPSLPQLPSHKPVEFGEKAPRVPLASVRYTSRPGAESLSLPSIFQFFAFRFPPLRSRANSKSCESGVFPDEVHDGETVASKKNHAAALPTTAHKPPSPSPSIAAIELFRPRPNLTPPFRRCRTSCKRGKIPNRPCPVREFQTALCNRMGSFSGH